MITDLDILRCAQILIKRYGDGAALEAAVRVDEMLDRGDSDGARVWRQIVDAIEEIQRDRRPDEPLN
jgi:hypothetical protein